MNYSVYKYPVTLNSYTSIHVPVNSQLLAVQEQHGQVQAWFYVNRNETDFEDVFLYIVGTGHDAPSLDHAHYHSTFQMANGDLVFHLFLRK